MAKIECPICDRDVSSSEAIGLGDSFKRHLMEVHRMTSLACIDMNEGIEPAKELSTYEVTRHVTVERPVGTAEGYREGTFERVESTTERMERKGTEVTRGTAGKARETIRGKSAEGERESRIWPKGSARSASRVVDEHARQDITSAGGYEAETRRAGETAAGKVVGVSRPREELEDVRRTGPEFAIKCPFCNSIFRADDDDELGRDLKGHWGDDHQIRPTIRAELGMSRAR